MSAAGRPAALAGALLVLLTGLAYAGVTDLGFVSFDDVEYVTGNPQVQQGLSLAGLRWAFQSTVLANWHPLTWLSHMAAWELGGADPAVHHGLNLLLHGANVLLLFTVLRAATGACWRSFGVAALFAVHPLHVESVAWVSERKDVLGTFFWLLAMAAYLGFARRPGPGRMALTAACLTLSLVSKPMAVTLPFALLLLDAWPLRRLPPLGRRVAEKLPLFAIVLAFSVLTFLVQQRVGAVGSLDEYGLGARLSNAILSVARYLGQTVWPTGLAVFYPFPREPAPVAAAAAAAGLLAASAGAWALRARVPALLVGWLWFGGTLVPVIGLVQVGAHAHADRYTYVPHIGLFLAAVWGLAALAERIRVPLALRAALAAATLLALVGLTRAQVDHWRDDVALFGHALRVTRDNHVAHLFLGEHERRRGAVDEAAVHFERALAIRPELAVAHNNLAAVRFVQGDVQASLRHYDEALRLQPDYAAAHKNRGLVLLASGRSVEAIASFRAATEIRPDFAEAHLGLGQARLAAGHGEEALDGHREALRLAEAAGDAAGRTRALRALASVRASHPDPALRDGEEALRLAERLAVLDPSGHPLDLDVRAQAYAEVGRFEEARTLGLQALQKLPPQERELREAMRERTRGYGAGRPYRSPPSPAGSGSM